MHTITRAHRQRPHRCHMSPDRPTPMDMAPNAATTSSTEVHVAESGHGSRSRMATHESSVSQQMSSSSTAPMASMERRDTLSKSARSFYKHNTRPVQEVFMYREGSMNTHPQSARRVSIHGYPKGCE